MAENKKSTSNERLYLWVKEKKQKATSLIKHTDDLSCALFSSDDIVPFLDLVSRLHYYDARNLLLIYERFPAASCLAGFKLWAKMIQPQDAQILKREWIGKGIDLLAPFTESYNGKFYLVWYSVTVYDIAQTNVIYSPPPSSYLEDMQHPFILLKAFQRVFSDTFGYSILMIPPTPTMRASGLPGMVSSNKLSVIQIRSDISQIEKIRWLTELLIRFYLKQEKQPLDFEMFLTRSISHCLFRIWGLPELSERSLKAPSEVPKRIQMSLLSCIQNTVRDIDEAVGYCYRMYRSEDEDLI